MAGMHPYHRIIAHLRRQIGQFALRRHWPVIVVLVVGSVISLTAQAWARRLELRDLSFLFVREAQTHANAVAALTESYLSSTHVLGDFFHSVPDLEEKEFRFFAGARLAKRPHILALEWVPRVAREDVPEFIEEIRQAGHSDYRITQIEPDGRVVPAADRPVYFPVAMVEPLAPNQSVLGLDMGSRPALQDALAEAERTGELRLSLPLEPIRAPGQTDGIIAFAPVYRESSGSRSLKGFAAGIYQMGRILGEATQAFPNPPMPVVHRLFLQSAPGQYRFVTGDARPESSRQIDAAALRRIETEPFKFAAPFNTGGQAWLFIAEPVEGAVAHLRTYRPLAILAFGLITTSFVAGYFWFMINRAAEIAHTVEQRTSELALTNATLRHENARRLAVEQELSQALDKERSAREAAQDAREALAVSEARYRVMGETIPYGVWFLDSHGQPEYFSQSFLDLLEMTLEETRDYGWTRRLAPEEVESAIASMRHALETGEMWEFEHRFMGPDRQYHIVLVRGLPVRDAAGRITSWVGINLDITQRKAAEEELRQHRDYLEELVRSRTLELMIGNEELRRDIEQREKVEEALRILQENLEEQVKLRTAELAAANRELEAFSYSVSHDLRAPLRHIVGFVQLLQKQSADRLNETGHRHLQVITQAANRMGKLIDDLLQFSRMGRSAMRIATVSLEHLIEDVRQELQADLNGREVEWVIDSDLPQVQADASLLRVVFVNLLSNALKYSRTRPKSRVEVGSVESAVGQATIFVRDNGVGFDMQYADRLFGVFQRLHKAEEFEGTGIGLAIVQRIIHRHGGRIWAEGAMDEGAIFYFTLPQGKDQDLDARLEAHSVGRG
jgi:PAS domain S-box-containing protein